MTVLLFFFPPRCHFSLCVDVDTTCVANLSQCVRPPGLACVGVVCPDGVCAASLDRCAPFDGCPTGQVKCLDDRCVSDPQLCLCSGKLFEFDVLSFSGMFVE